MPILSITNSKYYEVASCVLFLDLSNSNMQLSGSLLDLNSE